VSTVAGTCGLGPGKQDGAAVGLPLNKRAQFNYPLGVAVGPSGEIYVADTNNCTIRKIAKGQVSTFAGSTAPTPCGFADSPKIDPKFSHPRDVVFKGVSTLYVTDFFNYRVRVVTWR